MNIKESTGTLNGAPSGGQEVKFADTEIDWYDFGGGWTVAPGIQGTSNEAGNMASLCCIRNGKFYYTVIEGTFTEADLPEIRKEKEPKFAADVQRMTQGTQK